MLRVELDENAIDKIAERIADKAFEKFVAKLDNYRTIPAVMNREEFMTIFKISPKTFWELSKQKDFPISRELGGPKILRADILKFIRNSYANPNLYAAEWRHITPDRK